MAIHKLYIDDDDEINFHLIAIHTSMDDYKLAYFINKNMALKLKKCSEKENVIIKNKKGSFFYTKFLFEDKETAFFWSLIQNESETIVHRNIENQSLFDENKSFFYTKSYILPKYKTVNYFLKIEAPENTINLNDIINKLTSIERISMTYEVDVFNLKLKNDLTF